MVVSTGMLLVALGLQHEALTAPVLFYLMSSVLATAAFFMLTGMTERTRLTSTDDAGARRRAAPGRHLRGLRQP